jgi:hypothetical protein
MRTLRIALITMVLGPLGACLVTTDSTSGRSTSPGPGRPSGASISGRVVDSRTNAPIGQAAVDIITMDHKKLTSASTRADGTYRTDEVRPGTYIINVRRNGYEIESHQGHELRPGTSEFNFELDPK